MDTCKFSIHPSDGKTPVLELLRGVEVFVRKHNFPPSDVVVNPSDLTMMEKNAELLSVSPGGQLLKDGKVALLPYLTMRASQNVEAGSAVLEGTIEM